MSRSRKEIWVFQRDGYALSGNRKQKEVNVFTDSPISRACGRRIRGGVYAETRLSEDGLPIEYFIVDPPAPIDPGQLGLAAVGIKLIEIGGIHHIFDVVGQEFYPYPADYVEETRRLGASRRLPANLDFSRLGPGSRLMLVHARAVIENFSTYPQPPQVECPKGIDAHALCPLPEMCAGLWWHDLPDQPDESGLVLRQIEGGTQYRGYPRPAGLAPLYQHGVFLSLPISNLAVIQGGEATERNFQAASVSGLPVFLEEE
jgi:hypothetical protein